MSTSQPTVDPNEHAVKSEATIVEPRPPRDWKFWCIILSLAIATLLTAFELTSIGTALPIIVGDLGGRNFVWVGSGYTLGSTVLIPFAGGLCQIFGRRIVMLGSLLLFCIGSAICGSASSMNVLIGGRIIQGLGNGAATMTIQVIIADLVSLQERGAFNGVVALAWSIGGALGPVIGGALAEAGEWRWIFYLNLPICAVAAPLVGVFLHLKTPEAPLQEKLARLDWIGNFLVTASTTCVLIGLTWGGAEYAWKSAQVLAPLILGLAGLAVFLAYEGCFAKHPIVPMTLMSTRTALSGYIQVFVWGIGLSSIAYWLPVFFLACKGLGPTASGVHGIAFPLSVASTGIAAGLVIKATSRYRQPIWLAWMLVVIGVGCLTMLKVNSSDAKSVGFQVLAGVGFGIIWVGTFFPVLAPIPVTQNASAIAFLTFLRLFAGVWGVTIGGAVLQNELSRRLPAELLATFPEASQIAFAVIPGIGNLPPLVQEQVKNAFSDSLQILWQVVTGILSLGLLSSLIMKKLPLHTSLDSDWGREDVPTAKIPSIDTGEKV